MTSIAALRARIDQRELAARGVFRQPWRPTDFTEIRKFNPSEPRIPGGEHGGEWAHNPVGAVVDALKKVAGPDEHGVYFDDGRYLDWSTPGEVDSLAGESVRVLEVGDNDTSVQMDMSSTDQRSLFHALTLTVMADEGHPQSHHLAALAASGHEHMVFANGGYIDWSVKNPDGSRQIEAEDSSDSVQFDLSPAEFRQWQASLGLTQLQDAASEARSP